MRLKFIFLLSFFTPNTLVRCAKRSNVVVTGATPSSSWTRIESKKSQVCPKSHPFSMADGTKCCKEPVKLDDPSIHSDCDGSKFASDDSELCCHEKFRSECPSWLNDNARCRDNPNIIREGGWSPWGEWSVASTRDYFAKENPDIDAWEEGTCFTATGAPSGVTITYCHLVDILWDSIVIGQWGYWDDQSEEVPAFSKANYTDGDLDRWTEVEYICANTESVEFVNIFTDHNNYAHTLKAYANWACSKPATTYKEERTRVCNAPLAAGAGGKCSGPAMEYKGDRYIGARVSREVYLAWGNNGATAKKIFEHCYTCFYHSENILHPWVVYEYPDALKVQKITVYWRRDNNNNRLSDLDVRVGNFRFPKRIYGQFLAENALCGSLVGTQTTGFRPRVIFECPDPYLYGKYVSVQSSKVAAATIEVAKIALDLVYD